MPPDSMVKTERSPRPALRNDARTEPGEEASSRFGRSLLVLFVDAVYASVRTSEMAEGVVHLWDALNVAQHLTACGSQFGDGDDDVVDAEAEHDAVVQAVARNHLRVRLEEVEHSAVRHRKERPALLFHHGREAENLATQLLHRGKPFGLERDTVPSDAFDLHRSSFGHGPSAGRSLSQVGRPPIKGNNNGLAERAVAGCSRDLANRILDGDVETPATRGLVRNSSISPAVAR